MTTMYERCLSKVRGLTWGEIPFRGRWWLRIRFLASLLALKLHEGGYLDFWREDTRDWGGVGCQHNFSWWDGCGWFGHGGFLEVHDREGDPKWVCTILSLFYRLFPSGMLAIYKKTCYHSPLKDLFQVIVPFSFWIDDSWNDFLYGVVVARSTKLGLSFCC